MPIIALKPTATMRGTSGYDVINGRYRPDRAAMERAAGFLPQLRLMTPVSLVDAAEELADDLGMNVLGATFVTGLRRLGYAVTFAFTGVASGSEARVIRVLYPDLDSRVTTLSVAARARICEHNTGPFMVFSVAAGVLPAPQLLATLNVAKLAFRQTVATHVESARGAVRDNLVHVPNSVAEERRHINALYCSGRVPPCTGSR